MSSSSLFSARPYDSQMSSDNDDTSENGDIVDTICNDSPTFGAPCNATHDKIRFHRLNNVAFTVVPPFEMPCDIK